MAARSSDPNEDEVIGRIKSALDREKLKLMCETSNSHRSIDLSATFKELDRVVADVVKAKYGKLQYRHENEMAKIYPMLERIMDRVNRAIYRRLNPRMSKLHPWLVCFDVGMPRELFDLLYKNILSESCYGIEVKEGPRSVTIWFAKLRRLVVLFDKFVNCEGFEKELKGDKGRVKVVVDGERKGSFEYKIKEEILKVKLHYGYWNKYGISQH